MSEHYHTNKINSQIPADHHIWKEISFELMMFVTSNRNMEKKPKD